MRFDKPVRRARPLAWGLLFALTAALGAGCAGKGQVSGKVSYKGRPVTTGSVMILGGDKLPVYGPIQEDGTYAVDGVRTGEAAVAVISLDPAAVLDRETFDNKPGNSKAAPPTAVDRSKWFPIPDKYGVPEQSGLSVTVKRGQNAYDIELK